MRYFCLLIFNTCVLFHLYNLISSNDFVNSVFYYSCLLPLFIKNNIASFIIPCNSDKQDFVFLNFPISQQLKVIEIQVRG